MDLYDARALYISDMKRQGRSLNTLTAAERVLTDFQRSISSISLTDMGTPVEHLVSFDVENFLHREPALKPASFNRYRSVLKSFFDYCVKQGYHTYNPVDGVPPMKAAPEEPKLILTPEQMLSLLENANPVERIALAVGMNTGLRASDIVNLRVGDVDLKAGYIATGIRKTGGRDRKPITAELRAELQRWLADYKTFTNNHIDSGWFLIPSYTLSTFTHYDQSQSPWVWPRPEAPLTHPHRIVQRAIARLDLDPSGQGFHTLRRSSARALFEKLRADGSFDHALLVVKEFLNHKSITETQRYLGVNYERDIRDDVLKGKNFLTPPVNLGRRVSPASQGLTSLSTALGEAMGDINSRHGISYDNPERIY